MLKRLFLAAATSISLAGHAHASQLLDFLPLDRILFENVCLPSLLDLQKVEPLLTVIGKQENYRIEKLPIEKLTAPMQGLMAAWSVKTSAGAAVVTFSERELANSYKGHVCGISVPNSEASLFEDFLKDNFASSEKGVFNQGMFVYRLYEIFPVGYRQSEHMYVSVQELKDKRIDPEWGPIISLFDGPGIGE